jgi:endonuclease/exonuclease/phosphatase family metal-dependent hydrolase
MRVHMTAMSSQRLRLGVTLAILLSVSLVVVQLARAAGTVSLTGLGTEYTQTFDTLASSGTSSVLPTGWELAESGTNANTTYTAGTGSGNAGDTYSFGATGASERAFGMLQSGALIPTLGASFTNNTGSLISTLAISYVGEQWRLGTAGRPDRIDFQYSLDATSVTTGTWTDVDALDFNAPTTGPTIGALDGNAAANRTAVSGQITGLSIPNGATFWIRWRDFNASGADDGLAVDDFSLTPSVTDAAPFVTGTTPTNGDVDVATSANVDISFSEPVSVSAATFAISCATSGAHSFTLAGGPSVYTLDPDTDFATGETCTVRVDDQGVSDVDTVDPPDAMTADHVFSFTTLGVFARIFEIQGASHVSSFNGQIVSGVPGVITAVRPNSFTMQDAVGDGSVASSDAILVFRNGIGSTVSVGQAVLVSGRVTEFRPGGAASTNLTTTEITSPTVTPGGPGATIAPTVVGVGGRVPPASVIDDDATGDVETTGSFDPLTDGIDFYESLEAMLLQVNDPVVVGPTNGFGEVWVLPDGGAEDGIRTFRGGIVIGPSDFNPERIQLDDDIVLDSTPDASVGDGFTPAAVGVLDYNFGNFELLLTSALTRVDRGLQREVARAQEPAELAVATFNVENLSPVDPPAKFAELADLVVNNLRSPDIVALEEVQDNDGPANTVVTDASQTFAQLIAAIQSAGGPTYSFRQIDPVDDQDGGQPGGNIRVGFLFRTDRGLEFVDRPGATSLTPNDVTGRGNKTQLLYSPGRIDPQNAAWAASRKPLAAEFRYLGKTYFVIVNHFNSKGGDQPLYGRFQPPARITETQRHQQAQVVNDFVDKLVAADRNALIVVLGDLNDFEFSETLDILEGGVLTNLMDTLVKGERYSYVFEGNSQVLDQVVVSQKLAKSTTSYDVVHVNAEFFDQASDHDPQVARFVFGD